MELNRRDMIRIMGATSAIGLAPGAAFAKTFINIATAGATSTVYPVGIAMAEIFNDTIDDMSASAVTTGGTVDNMNQIGSREADIAFANSGVARSALDGAGAFEGNAIPQLRGLFASATQFVHLIARTDAGINSVADLRGKRFVPGGAGSGAERTSRLVLGAYGLDYVDRNDVEADFVGYSDAADKLKNGQADAALFTGAAPLGAAIDVYTSGKVKLVPVSGPEAEGVASDVPAYFVNDIPAGTYSGQDEAISTLSVSTIVACHADLPADLVTQMLAAIFANQPKLAAAHASMKPLTIERGSKGMTLPWHDGAMAFFASNGVSL